MRTCPSIFTGIFTVVLINNERRLHPGPISVAVYVERGTTTFWYTKKMQSLLAPRRNIALHLVSQEGVSAHDVMTL